MNRKLCAMEGRCRHCRGSSWNAGGIPRRVLEYVIFVELCGITQDLGCFRFCKGM